METAALRDVIVVGGIAGPFTATFTARHGLGTWCVGSEDLTIRRNIHIESRSCFPADINVRQLLVLLADRADRETAPRVNRYTDRPRRGLVRDRNRRQRAPSSHKNHSGERRGPFSDCCAKKQKSGRLRNSPSATPSVSSTTSIHNGHQRIVVPFNTRSIFITDCCGRF